MNRRKRVGKKGGSKTMPLSSMTLRFPTPVLLRGTDEGPARCVWSISLCRVARALARAPPALPERYLLRRLTPEGRGVQIRHTNQPFLSNFDKVCKF